MQRRRQRSSGSGSLVSADDEGLAADNCQLVTGAGPAADPPAVSFPRY